MHQVVEKGMPVSIFDGVDQGRLGREGQVGHQHIEAFHIIEECLPGLGAPGPLRTDLHAGAFRFETRVNGRPHVAIGVG